jgi:hypothetical protein
VSAAGRRLTRDIDATLGHAQRQLVSYNLALEQLAALRQTSAYRYGVRVRDLLRAVTSPARRVRAKLRRR